MNDKVRNALAQAVSRQLLTAEARVQSQALLCGIFVDSVLVGEIFLRELQLSFVSIMPSMPYTHSFMYHRLYTLLAVYRIVK
jgi:hypothetical protein